MKRDPRHLLEAVQSGELSIESALDQLRGSFFESVGGHSTIDHDRADRVGSAEVIFGLSKTPAQIVDIAAAMRERGAPVLATRVSAEGAAALKAKFPETEYSATAGVATIGPAVPQKSDTFIGVISAGTSDQSVAEEARLTAAFLGNRVETFYDCGVAGLHRMFAHLDRIRQARALVVVAGMEGALPSVVGGQVACPIIAVPTSVGYGASFGGVAALLGMLNSCASGVSVVNIDNGFGAGFIASRINRM